MAIHPNPRGNRNDTSEAVGYVVIALMLLVCVSIVLEKAGVRPLLSVWASYLTITALTVAACLWVRSTRLVIFAAAGRNASHSLIGMAQLAATAPCGLIVAFWANAEITPPTIVASLIALAAALWASTLLFGVALNRSGSYSLPALLEVRYGSVMIRILAVIASGAPTFLLICCQLLAFGLLAEHLLEIPVETAIPAGAAISVLIIWLSGSTGGQIAAAIAIAMFVVTFAPIYWQFGLQERLPAVSTGLPADMLKQISEAASPILTETVANENTRLDQIMFVAATAAALSVLPIFTQFHPAAAKGWLTARIALATTLTGAALAAVIVNAVPAGLLFATNSGTGVIVALAELSVLVAIPACAAILLLGLSGMLSFDGYHGIGMGPGSENGRLITSRITILAIGGAAGWVAYKWGQAVVEPMISFLFLAPSILFPAAVAGVWWKRCGAISALAGMATGGAVFAGVWAVGAGLLDVSALVAETSPVLEFISSRTMAQASIIGMAGGAAALVLFAFLPANLSRDSEAILAAMHEDRRVRPLNETAL